jgi:hypothetical protein
MKWVVVARPQAEDDVLEAAAWYDTQLDGLGDQFIEEILAVFHLLEINPLLNCRRHSTKNIRWPLSQAISLSSHLRSKRREEVGDYCCSNSCGSP